MVDLGDIPKSYANAVQTLAKWHGEDDDGPWAICSFPDEDGQTVRLLEVSENVPESDTVMPLVIGPSGEFPFKSAVILLTPREWERVKTGELALPGGWGLKSQKQVWPA